VLLAACKSAPIDRPLKTSPIETGPGTMTEARRFLEGSWLLVSMDIFPPGGSPIHAAATGMMVYDEFANMRVELRFAPESALLAQAIGIPLVDGVLTTTGRTMIDPQHRAVSYVLEGQPELRASTHPLDTNRPRYWEVRGDELTLRTRDQDGTPLSVTVWRRVTPLPTEIGPGAP
jgi:hypothetical protein